MRDAVCASSSSADFSCSAPCLQRFSSIYLLPEGDRCPNCDAVTLRVQSRGWNVAHADVSHQLVLRVRLARTAAQRTVHSGAVAEPLTKHRQLVAPKRGYPTDAKSRSHSGQFPVSSKKSSKYTSPRLSSSAMRSAECFAVLAVDRVRSHEVCLRRGIRPAVRPRRSSIARRVSPLRLVSLAANEQGWRVRATMKGHRVYLQSDVSREYTRACRRCPRAVARP